MKLTFLRMIVPVFLALALSAFAQNSFDPEERKIEDQAERLLQKREIGELANEMASRKAATDEDLLLRLSIFARAGQRVRVRETLNEIVKIYAASGNQQQIRRVAQKALSGSTDLAARKIYYQQIAVGGDGDVTGFIDLWLKNGNANELEKWLLVRADESEDWWYQWVQLTKQRGLMTRSGSPLDTNRKLSAGENEIADNLEAKIRVNPADFSLVRKYLQVVSTYTPTQIGPGNTEYHRDISWLAEVTGKDSAYRSYQLGTILRDKFPAAAIELFKRSLAIDFNQTDAKLFAEENKSETEAKNPEKQLRFWAKKSLAETYQKNGQIQLAQPLIEQLTAMEISDIDLRYDGYAPQDHYALAGAVQSAGGQRIVETKILQNQATDENSPDYWLNRVSYYRGRGEKDAIRQTFSDALAKFPYSPNDLKNSYSRVRILSDLRYSRNAVDSSEITNILRGEFKQAQVKGDAAYLFYLVQYLAGQDDFLSDEFVINTDLLPQILAVREKWGDEEHSVIENALESGKWNKQKREAVWDKLSQLARLDVRNRAYTLTEAMDSGNRRIVPLLEECLKIAPVKNPDESGFDRADVEISLFDAYLAVADWQKAEKMFNEGFRSNGEELGKIAVAAAKNGQIADALRVWKLNANIDRRNFYFLSELSLTAAKPLLREFYLQMKKSDALTDAPDKALKMLP